jgi:hypothetical membrane protein
VTRRHDSLGSEGRGGIVAGGLLWLAGLEYFAAEAIARHAAVGYTAARDTISLLGVGACSAASCSPHHLLMNAGIVLSGLTIAGGAALSRPAWPQAPAPRAGLFLLGAGGIGTAMAGLWPLDSNPGLHLAGAILTFAIGNLGMLLMGLGLMRARPILGGLGFGCGLLSIAAFALFAADLDFGLGRGAIERAAVYPKIVWLALTGAAVVGASRQRRMKSAG